MNFLIQTKNPNDILSFGKIYFISIFTLYLSLRFMNKANSKNNKKFTIIIINILVSICYIIIKNISNQFYSTIFLIVLLSIIVSKKVNSNIGYSILITTISLSINYIIFFISILISFIPNAILDIENNMVGLSILLIIYIILICGFTKIKRLSKGISFLRNKENDDKFDILILNMSVIILFTIIILTDYQRYVTGNLMLGLIIFSALMFITIQKSLQLYYKQKLLVQELNETKSELEKKTKEIEELEKENLSFSKKSHTLAHKQKSLEYKLQEIMLKTEISKEETIEVEDRLKEIEKDLYKEKTTIELDKTGISQIDDMLKYMQSECIKNKIDFELQLNGNIYYMTNNLIAKEDLETLLADHIKNAIIAINHTDNLNRSILVRLGKIDEIYGLYIYDSGVEFELETLENLGKKPSTTHSDEGGTGMGFMNTFDTLRKCNASLMIEEYNEPSKDNYTKAIMIKFDNKNEFKIKLYRENKVNKK